MRFRAAALALLFALPAICCGCGRPAQTGTAPRLSQAAVQVTVINPVRKTIVRTTTQPGYIEAFDDAPIYAKVAGYVERLHVDIGDRVRGPHYSTDGKLIEPGQLLLELFVPELKDEHRQKQAMVRQAEAARSQARSAVKVAEAARASAQAALRRWESENRRVAELVRGDAVTPKLGDETRAQFETAQADVNQAVAQLEKSHADVQSAEANLQLANADQQRVASLVEYTQIRAPLDGVITRRSTNVGHFVPAGDNGGAKPVLALVRADVVRVFLDVPELDAARVDPGDEASIQIEALEQRQIQGKVTRISWALDNTARTLRTEVDVPNPSGQLRPGMFARVTISLEKRENALVLPNAAISGLGDEASCWVAAEGKAERRPVQVGIINSTECEIRGGLGEAEQVIISGLGTLKPEQPVKVTPPTKP